MVVRIRAKSPARRATAPRRRPAAAPAKRASRKRIWLFEEGNATMRDLLGGKGAGLAEMSRVGLPVPPGFTITTAVCNEYNARGRQFPPGLMDEVRRALWTVERKMGKKFGDPANPLLVSVRSGARFSMPGMMDTVLNLGLNEETLRGLAALTGNERFARDAYRRFVQMFGKIVLGVPGERFEAIIEEHKRRTGARVDTDLGPADLSEIARAFQDLIRREQGVEFSEDPWRQLELAIRAVFDSWMGKRAVDYRNFNKNPHDPGPAGEGARRLVPAGRPGRGRGGRHPDAPLDHGDGQRDAGRVRAVSKRREDAGAALQGRAGSRVHGRARQVVDAANAQREAHRASRGEDR